MLKKIALTIYDSLNLLFSFLYLRYRGVETKLGYVRLSGLPLIWKHPGSKIILGKNIQLTSTSRFNTAGINHPVILATLAKDAVIEMRDHSGASGVAINAVKSVLIDSYAQIGVNTNIYDTDFHCLDPEARRKQKNILEAKSAPVVIGKNVWISANATILKGVTIGENSVVGASSVVAKSVDKNVIVAGNPAVMIRKLVTNEEDMANIKAIKKINSVTIVTPSYNQAEFIEETIESIWSQSGDIKIEHIVADGGSTDKTVEILKKYDKLYQSGKYPFKCRQFVFKWWSKEDKGQTDAIMKGFDQASGDILNWINSDDILLGDKALSKTIEAFNDNKADIIVGKGKLIDEKSIEIGEGASLSKISGEDQFQQLLPTLKKGDFLFQQSVFFRKSILKDCPLDRSLRYCMDWDLYLKFLGAQKDFHFINSYLGAIREQPDAKTQIMPVGVYKERLNIYKSNHVWSAGRIHSQLKILFFKYKMLDNMINKATSLVARCLPFYDNRKLLQR